MATKVQYSTIYGQGKVCTYIQYRPLYATPQIKKESYVPQAIFAVKAVPARERDTSSQLMVTLKTRNQHQQYPRQHIAGYTPVALVSLSLSSFWHLEAGERKAAGAAFARMNRPSLFSANSVLQR